MAHVSNYDEKEEDDHCSLSRASPLFTNFSCESDEVQGLLSPERPTFIPVKSHSSAHFFSEHHHLPSAMPPALQLTSSRWISKTTALHCPLTHLYSQVLLGFLHPIPLTMMDILHLSRSQSNSATLNIISAYPLSISISRLHHPASLLTTTTSMTSTPPCTPLLVLISRCSHLTVHHHLLNISVVDIRSPFPVLYSLVFIISCKLEPSLIITKVGNIMPPSCNMTVSCMPENVMWHICYLSRAPAFPCFNSLWFDYFDRVFN